jgi:CheY-like chemotaxis protein/two-component sensor histidine kinase
MTTLLAECESVVETPQRAANRRIEKVLATLGHEIRNPLSALSHALEIWPSVQNDQTEMAELRSLMQRQVRQLIRLSDDLMDGSRIAQGEFILRREHVLLRQLIDDACEQVRPFVDRCGHALTVTVPDEPIAVYGDPSRLLQVFANLIQNAAKFTGRNGRLCVTVERLDGMAVVQVCDNGPGIEEHMLSEIFEAFAQVKGTHGPENDGLGIGLRLVKTIVELHGGSIAARSAGLGQGSEFTVLLPLSDDRGLGHRPAAQPVAEVNGHGRRPSAYQIVVVDDDRSIGELLASLLHTIGHSVTVADNGATAVRMVLDERPQVVFLDLVMHGMDGCEVARQLRDKPELDGLVLIALSGYGDEESRRRAEEAGFDKYLVKPIGIATLAETLAGLPAAVQTCPP